MIIGCKEHCECACPDFPDKCALCGWYIDERKKKMYKVQYLSKGKKKDVWCYVRDSNNSPLTFHSIHEARKCMRRCYEIGYDARITEFDYGSGCHYWVEKMER